VEGGECQHFGVEPNAKSNIKKRNQDLDSHHVGKKMSCGTKRQQILSLGMMDLVGRHEAKGVGRRGAPNPEH